MRAKISATVGEPGDPQLRGGEVHRYVRGLPGIRLFVPRGQLGAGALECPEPDRRDQARLLSEADEAVGADHPIAVRLPAQERFHADGIERRDVDDRLVHEHELVAIERAAQCLLHVEAALGALADGLVEEDGGTVAPLLGGVHRAVGIAQHALGISLRCQRRAAAHGEHDLIAAYVDRLRNPWAIRLASSRTSSAVPTYSGTTTNSSPAKRDTVSVARTVSRSRAAITPRTSSLALWPRVSLTYLKRSRSRNSTLPLRCRDAGSASAHATGGRGGASGWAGP